ncbi:MAG TPA: glycosyltransferase family 9 protein [Segetibacter sp.]|nr:glycosyltransferase family 9 protein [Segetibacter sp.]
MKFLIIRFSSIGDIVLTTPVIRCVKEQVPGAEIHYLTKENFKGIIESNPYVSKIHVLNDDLVEVIRDLKQENFNFIIDLHHNLRTLKVKKALKKVPSFSFEKLNIEKWVYTALKINILPDVHIVDRYLNTVKRFGVTNDGKGLDYFIPKNDVVPPGHIPIAQSLGFIGIVIGAARNTKKLPVHKLKELCTKIDHPLILLGGPEDRMTGDEIASVDPIKIYNSCGKFNLNKSADIVRRAKLIITHDTGLMHIAAAFKKPVITIWGNTVPSFGMGPYYGDAMVANILFGINGLWCRPCSKIGYSKCPLGHFKCMEKHNVAEIVKTVQSSF